jgi:signal transduction histidine kinase
MRRHGEPLPETYLGNVWSALVLPGVGLLLIGRAQWRTMGWLFSAGGVSAGLAAVAFAWAAWAGAQPDWVGWAGWAVWVGSWAWMGSPLAGRVVVLLLPGGSVDGWRRRGVVVVVAGTAVLALVAAFTGTMPTDPISGATVAAANPLGVAALEPLIWPVFGVVTLLLLAIQVTATVRLTRIWRDSRGPQRAESAWLCAGAWVMLLPWGAAPVVGSWLDALAVPGFAVTVAVGLLRFAPSRSDSDFNRAYLWASLTTCLVAGYLLVVTLLSAVVQQAGGASVAMAASGVVALAVAPLRSRLQRSVDRTLYGARADPYASIAGLSRRLEATMSPDEVLPIVVRTMGEELQLPYAACRLTGSGQDLGVFSYGTPRGDLVSVPVEYLGQQVGELVVSTPSPAVALRPAEERLLADLARQAGVAAHGVATIVELRRSRERLVSAREEERQSLRRELHDELGALLTGAALGIDITADHLPPGSPAVEQLGRARAAVSSAIEDLRRIIAGLRPPALDEVGLTGALKARFSTLQSLTGAVIHVDSAALPALPPAVEVAGYHIAVEAVHNAIRHASPTRIAVTLTHRPDSLLLAVSDDGRWADPADGSGQGLTTMRRRAEEIGGRLTVTTGAVGTTLSVELPTGGCG